MRNIRTKINSLNRWNVGGCWLCLQLLTFTVKAPTPFTPFNTLWRGWREGEWKSDPSASNESQWNVYMCMDRRMEEEEDLSQIDKKQRLLTVNSAVKSIIFLSNSVLLILQHDMSQANTVLLKWKPKWTLWKTWPQYPQTCSWRVVVLLFEDLVAFFLSLHVLNHHGTVWVHGLRLKIKKSRVTHEITQQCSNDDSGQPHWCVVSVTLTMTPEVSRNHRNVRGK